jgi:hypothetical protein
MPIPPLPVAGLFFAAAGFAGARFFAGAGFLVAVGVGFFAEDAGFLLVVGVVFFGGVVVVVFFAIFYSKWCQILFFN